MSCAGQCEKGIELASDEISGNDRPQALWVFSSAACGVYGFPELNIADAGRSGSRGQIVLESAGNVKVPAGSGLLLRVLPAM